MSDDPLPLPNFFAELRSKADYETIYAKVMGSEGGRWFLGEYAARNRHADTLAIVAALARVEADIRHDPPPQVSVAVVRELNDLAAALGRVGADIAAQEASEAFAGAERVEDIVLVLREREVESALCDALAAASRELRDALARSDGAVDRARRAARQLRGLAIRLNAIAAVIGSDAQLPAGGVHAVSPAASATAIPDEATTEEASSDAASRPPGLTAAEALEDEFFAQSIGTLAATFPTVEEAGETGREADGPAPYLVDHTTNSVPPFPEPPLQVGPDEDPGDLFEPHSWLPPIPLLAGDVWAAGSPVAPTGFGVVAADLSDSGGAVTGIDANDDSRRNRGEIATSVTARAQEGMREEGTQAEPNVGIAGERSDQIDAIEAGRPSPSAAQLTQATSELTAFAASRPSAGVMPAETAKPPFPRSDPLAPVLALSEEELIALFS